MNSIYRIQSRMKINHLRVGVRNHTIKNRHINCFMISGIIRTLNPHEYRNLRSNTNGLKELLNNYARNKIGIHKGEQTSVSRFALFFKKITVNSIFHIESYYYR